MRGKNTSILSRVDPLVRQQKRDITEADKVLEFCF